MSILKSVFNFRLKYAFHLCN